MIGRKEGGRVKKVHDSKGRGAKKKFS